MWDLLGFKACGFGAQGFSNLGLKGFSEHIIMDLGH